MNKLNELIKKIRKYDDGDEIIIPLIREALSIVDSENNLTYMISLRYDLLYCYLINAKADIALKLVSDLTRIMDEYYDELDEDDIKFIMGGCSMVYRELYKFPQIPINKLLTLHEDFKERLIKNSMSLFNYYEMKLDFLAYLDEKEEFKKIFKKYLELDEKKAITGCVECNESFKLDYFIYLEDIESCNAILKKYYNKELKCKEAYGNITTILFATNCARGKLEEASKVVDQFEELLIKDIFYLNEFCNLILYYGIKDETHAIKLIETYIDKILKAIDPLCHVKNFTLIWLFFEKIKNEGKEKIVLKLPNTLAIYKDDDIYNIDKLANFFKNKALNILLKFRKTNGNTNIINLYKIASNLFLNKNFEDII